MPIYCSDVRGNASSVPTECEQNLKRLKIGLKTTIYVSLFLFSYRGGLNHS